MLLHLLRYDLSYIRIYNILSLIARKFYLACDVYADVSFSVHMCDHMQSEIRTDCEVCFDSERVRSREMGVYSKGKLKSRFCSNAEVRGD